MFELLSSSDIQDVSDETGLVIREPTLLPVVVTTLNEAFSNYANATAIQVSNSPASERQNWCAALTQVAADLHRGLGHTERSLSFEPSAFNAAEILQEAWPSDPQSPEDHELHEQLVSALMVALPDRHPVDKGARGTADFDADLLVLMGRLGPALRIVSLLAATAENVWKNEKGKSDNAMERGRRHLMERVVGSYARLFGAPPAASPGSKGFRWAAALIARAGQAASDQLQHPVKTDSPEQSAETVALRAIEGITSHLQPPRHKTVTSGTSKLDHWIRDALKSAYFRNMRP